MVTLLGLFNDLVTLLQCFVVPKRVITGQCDLLSSRFNLSLSYLAAKQSRQLFTNFRKAESVKELFVFL